jgi:hypothetical protein
MKVRYIFISTLIFFGQGNGWLGAKAIANQAHIKDSSESNQLNSGLSELTWSYRIIITELNGTDLPSMLNKLSTQDQALAERKIALFIVTGKQVLRYHAKGKTEATSLIDITQAQNRLRQANTLLIGLDGGTKGVYESLNLRRIFADIDGMPMRRSELGRF